MTIHRANDGYYNRYAKGDVVIPYRCDTHDGYGVHVPGARATIPYSYLLLLLNGVEVQDGQVVDHIDGDRANNTLDNLRVVTQTLNCRNAAKAVGATGEKCITRSVRTGSYIVRVTLKGIRKYLGSTKTLEEAIALRDSVLEERIADGYTLRHLQ